jgi:hypothetical protein
MSWATNRGPRDLLSALYTLVETSADNFGIYTDMSGAQLSTILDVQTAVGLDELLAKLDDFGDMIDGLKTSVDLVYKRKKAADEKPKKK